MKRIRSVAELAAELLRPAAHGPARPPSTLVIVRSTAAQRMLAAALRDSVAPPAPTSLVAATLAGKPPPQRPLWRCVTESQLGLALWRDGRRLPADRPFTYFFERAAPSQQVTQVLLTRALPRAVSRAVLRVAERAQKQLLVPPTAARVLSGGRFCDSDDAWRELFALEAERLCLSGSFEALVVRSARALLDLQIEAAGGGRAFGDDWSAVAAQRLAQAQGSRRQRRFWLQDESGGDDAHAPPFSLTRSHALYLPVVHGCAFPQFDRVVLYAKPTSLLSRAFYGRLLLGGASAVQADLDAALDRALYILSPAALREFYREFTDAELCDVAAQISLMQH